MFAVGVICHSRGIVVSKKCAHFNNVLKFVFLCIFVFLISSFHAIDMSATSFPSNEKLARSTSWILHTHASDSRNAKIADATGVVHLKNVIDRDGPCESHSERPNQASQPDNRPPRKKNKINQTKQANQIRQSN